MSEYQIDILPLNSNDGTYSLRTLAEKAQHNRLSCELARERAARERAEMQVSNLRIELGLLKQDNKSLKAETGQLRAENHQAKQVIDQVITSPEIPCSTFTAHPRFPAICLTCFRSKFAHAPAAASVVSAKTYPGEWLAILVVGLGSGLIVVKLAEWLFGLLFGGK